jgi:uncharacterized repeat protein (TIGR01451 family)
VNARRSALLSGIALVPLAVGILMLASPAMAAGPELEVAISHTPDTFQRGDIDVSYTVTVKNRGDSPTFGTIDVADVLSSGLRLDAVNLGVFFCPTTAEVNAGAALTCSTSEAIGPGESLELGLAVITAADAPATVFNEATASGGGTTSSASATDSTPVVDRPAFAVEGFTARALDQAEADYALAGGHPYEARTTFGFPTYAIPFGRYPVEDPKDIIAELPPGFIGNGSAFPRCPLTALQSFVPACPPGSAVGQISFGTRGDPGQISPIYNMIPERGYPAEFAFKSFNNAVVAYPVLRPRSSSYRVAITTPGAARLGITSIGFSLYGIPSLHNGFGGPEVPLVSNPVDCLETKAATNFSVDSWQNPGPVLGSGAPDLGDPRWETAVEPAPPLIGCDSPALVDQWKPAITAAPIQLGDGPKQADSPAGLRVGLDFPQSNDPTDPEYISGAKEYDPSIPQAPELKDATVKLPAGLSISPSAADGLGACSDLASDPAGDQVHYDNTDPVSCPDSSKVGTVTATSPLLAAHDPETDEVTGPEAIEGDVYIVKPHPGDLAPGTDGIYRLLIQLESAKYGINVKLPGTATADQSTGQLTATFIENPQLPVSHLELDLNSGPRAPLATPTTCGHFTTTTDLVPWSTPGTPDAHPSSSFDINSGCASTPGQRPFAPTLSAGTESSTAGAASPFVLKITRGDGEQELSQVDTTLPKGLLATLKGVPYCSDAAIAAAGSKSGAAEQASSSCPAASQIGTITAGAGPGTNPYYVSGKAYLAGPYKGAPLSVAFITPAVAGPFDLGNVVVRAALGVNPETAQVTVKTDPLPQILDGVPLRLRSVVARVDRPNFTLNPTNCEPMAVTASIGGASGASATPSNSFQVGNCEALAFKPSLKLSLKGATRRTGHPALRAVVTYPQGGGYANIARAQVSLPHSEFLDQGNIGKACTRVLLVQHACPAASIYGRVTAWTPLLEKPLEGPVYLVGGYGYKLPALVAELNGQIQVLLVGKVDTGPNKGIRNTFEAVPDAPVERFVLEMKGGKRYGLLENSEDICRKPQKAGVAFAAQNGRAKTFSVKIANSCGTGKKARHQSRRRG